MRLRPLALLSLAAGLAGSLAGPARAAELKVLAAGATESTLRAVVPRYEDEGGHTLLITFGAVGALRDDLRAGVEADVVIATPAILDELGDLVRPGSRVALGTVGGGIAVCAGAPRPDVSTPDALRRAILAAREIHFADPARATAGAHFMKVADDLGVLHAVRARGRPAPGGRVAMESMSRACAGAIGLTQVSEILSVPGVVLVGPYPPGLQQLTAYTGAVAARARDAAAAEDLLRYLASPPVQARFARAGFEAAR